MPFTATTIKVRAGSTQTALERLREWLDATGLDGHMHACLYSEIGSLDRIMMIHDYPSGGMFEDRDRMIDSTSAFGLGDLFRAASIETYTSFDRAPLLPPGSYGPYYEVREYMLTADGLAATKEKWHAHREGRRAHSTPFVAATASTGTMHRLLNIWPYRTLADRALVRRQAVESGAWPPKGGIDFIRRLTSEIYLAADFSKAQ